VIEVGDGVVVVERGDDQAVLLPTPAPNAQPGRYVLQSSGQAVVDPTTSRSGTSGSERSPSG
jgi:hypothetical protein